MRCGGQGVPGQLWARLWGLSGLRADAAPQDVLAWTRAPVAPVAPVDPLANLTGLMPPRSKFEALTRHDSRIGTASVILDGPIPDAVFDLWLDSLIGLRGSDILRVKGIVFLEGIESPFVFHGVQHIFDPPVPMQNWPGGDRRSRIVVIAKDISRPRIAAQLRHSEGGRHA